MTIWANVKTIATEPRKIAYVLAGSVLAQLLVATALGTSLHAVGEHASIATILVVITLASIVGGAVPVPGGLGVVEAGLIAGLTSAGIPQEQAVAAVFIQRLFTAYLPPDLGLVHPRLDAPPRVRVTRQARSTRHRPRQEPPRGPAPKGIAGDRRLRAHARQGV